MTHAERMVAAIEKTMEQSPGVLEVEVDGQTTRFESLQEMKNVRDEYKREIYRQNRRSSSQIDLGSAWE